MPSNAHVAACRPTRRLQTPNPGRSGRVVADAIEAEHDQHRRARKSPHRLGATRTRLRGTAAALSADWEGPPSLFGPSSDDSPPVASSATPTAR
jgi:hypothetical protein